MKMRSTLFLTLSLIVHAVCVAALAVSHFRSVEAPAGNNVEMTVGEQGDEGSKINETNEAKPEQAPAVKPIEKTAEIVKPLPKKAPAPAKKIVKAVKPAEVLPAKEKVAEAEPEKLNPAIDDSEAVAVAQMKEETAAVEKQEEVEFKPVKEEIAGVAPADEAAVEEEKTTEATAHEAKATDPAPSAAAEATQNLGHGGESKAEAVNYLELKQFSGNKAPTYPMQARKDKRQGQVDLLYRVTKEGRVAEVQIAKTSGHADLDEAAVKAIAKFRFVPGQEGWARHPVIFALKGEAAALPSKLRSNNASAE